MSYYRQIFVDKNNKKFIFVSLNNKFNFLKKRYYYVNSFLKS